MVVWNNSVTEEPSYIPGKGWIQDQILPLGTFAAYCSGRYG